MSRRRALETHLHKLIELSEIMHAMKNLALMEQRKISRMAASQSELTDALNTVAADFLKFHGNVLPASASGTPIYLLIGSQRGFCGDFNNRIREELDSVALPNGAEIIAVGERLHDRMKAMPHAVTKLNGPSVCEEVERVLNGLLDILGETQQRHKRIDLVAIHHGLDDGAVVRTPLLPPFRNHGVATPPFSTPPILNVAPEEFWEDLIDQYLFAKLFEIFYVSLLAENQQRIDHMAGAVQHLEEKTEELGRKSRALRLEEITEEIEVILLSAAENK